MEENRIYQAFEKIEKVSPSPFLKTRIDSKIEALDGLVVSKKFGLSLLCSFLIIVVINVIVIQSNTTNPTDQESMNFGVNANFNLY